MNYREAITTDHRKVVTVKYTDHKGLVHCMRGPLHSFLHDMQNMSLYEIASIIKNAEIIEE